MAQDARMTVERCPNWRRCGAYFTLADSELEAMEVRRITGECRAVSFLEEVAEWYTLRFRLTGGQGRRILAADFAPMPVGEEYQHPDCLYVLLVNYPWYFLWVKPVMSGEG
jgi:hypothetical protein